MYLNLLFILSVNFCAEPALSTYFPLQGSQDRKEHGKRSNVFLQLFLPQK
jgi:hypothetical protein